MSETRPALQWSGKDEKPQSAAALLREDPSQSYGDTTTDNRVIFGDNLPALQALAANLGGRVKCVFIDPPYNTGTTFSHFDDGIEHCQWLGMIRDRLRLIHPLLSEDGSLWISIDDNECHYLKVLCDEIFGRPNFVANVIWQKKYTMANDARYFSGNHDHILVYAKNKTIWRPNKLPRSDSMNSRYTNPDGHPKGAWKSTPLHAKSGREKNFSFRFKNGVEWSPPPGTFPRFSADTLRRLDENDEIWFGRHGKAMPSRKTFLSELTRGGTPPLTVWHHTDVGHTHEAKTEVKAFNADDVFVTPKPERLMQRILHIASQPGDRVLDCFAGSGTTGAVAHKMGRRWIVMEQGPHCHSHILPRLRQVVDGLDHGGISEAVGWHGGGGFRYFQVVPSP